MCICQPDSGMDIVIKQSCHMRGNIQEDILNNVLIFIR